MSWKVLFIKLLLLHYATQSRPRITADCHEDVSLRCPGVDLSQMDFLSVAWFKRDSKIKHGIVRRHKDKDGTRYYNFSRSPKLEFGENYSLRLLRVTPNDSGTYECDISANVGGRNQNLQVDLTVYECATPADPTTTAVLNMTQGQLCSNKQVEELPVMWSIIGYLAVGLAKIVVSLITIWVIRAACTRSSRGRRRQKW
ncbi:uncharacterized protein LOC131971931 isoform X2 [Centropristis striata]|uniref:uncharacterized protein LOC131971931 isoform X2 n=1 Tax=Centropristis striata TaxID=184440 RepID=UPI0027E0B521|nr:uncharacterized protein LOC131971931 isoform X2 [Centropristis striata]